VLREDGSFGPKRVVNRSPIRGGIQIFRTDALPISTQLRGTWHTDSLDMVFLPSTSARATTTTV
jgi:hypothetical protein